MQMETWRQDWNQHKKQVMGKDFAGCCPRQACWQILFQIKVPDQHWETFTALRPFWPKSTLREPHTQGWKLLSCWRGKKISLFAVWESSGRSLGLTSDFGGDACVGDCPQARRLWAPLFNYWGKSPIAAPPPKKNPAGNRWCIRTICTCWSNLGPIQKYCWLLMRK